MELTVKDKGNKEYKATVTSSGEVRIKMKSNDTSENKKIQLEMLTKACQRVLERSYPVTLRARFREKDRQFTLGEANRKNT